MAAPATVDELLDLVRKSGVADEKRLDAYLQKMRERLPAELPQAAEALVRDGQLTHFQAENILQGKWRRFSIGKYKVLERLGSGGMGQVFLCEHKLMRRRVAVKVLPTAKAKDSSALERFYREARAVAALTHPNIVHAYDIDQDEDLHFLVMEYVDGANFQEIVKKSGPLNVLRACHYIRQSALALQHAHEAGLVHRDVKPGNIIVDRGGVVKILDMGLARFFHDEDDVLTKKYDDGVLGTADYLSPEQSMDSHAADIRADIYSLGATFYFLLTGRPPFESANVVQKLMMHQLRNPKPIQESRSDVPAGVLAITLKMMAKDPNQRYRIPAEVADALEPFTREAIEPPLDSEMPHLSAAATGNYASVEAAEANISKTHVPLSAPRLPAASDSAKAAASVATCAATHAPAARLSTRPASAPVAVAPPPIPAPVVKAAPVEEVHEEVHEEAPWEAYDQDTEDSSAKLDTKPQSSRPSAKSKKNLLSRKNGNVLVIVLLLVVFGIAFFVTAAGGLAYWYFHQPAPMPLAPTGPPKLEVSKDHNRPSAYRSIQLALRNAKTGSIIELMDDIYEENVVIDPSKGPTGITLQAAPGKEVLWRSSKNDVEQPIIKLAKAADFKFKARGITLDGSLDKTRQVNDLMLITSDCAGLVVEDLQCKSFARTAILIMNSTGSSENPIRISHLVTVTEKNEKPRSAIYFDAIANMNPSRNENIEIKDCVFQGLDPAKAIQAKDEKVLDKTVRWPGR